MLYGRFHGIYPIYPIKSILSIPNKTKVKSTYAKVHDPHTTCLKCVP